MKDVYESGENMFKTCVKMLPFTHSCMATHEEMEKLANELLPLHFPEGAHLQQLSVFSVMNRGQCANV